MMKNNKSGFVYSTNPDFEYEKEERNFTTLPPHKQTLLIQKSTKHRAGKIATVVSGFHGSDNDLEKLAKLLKTKCGVGGSAKDGEIIIQGDVKDKVAAILSKEGYKLKGI